MSTQIEIQQMIGEKIRYYRKENKITLDQLGCKISKSKATVSKYESGEVCPDVVTLLAISKALNIHIYQLLQSVTECEYVRSETAAPAVQSPFGTCSELYIYYYDGRYKRIRCGRIFISRGSEAEHGDSKVFLNMNIGENKNTAGVEYLTLGTMTSYDLFTVFSFEQINGVGNANMYVYNPFGSSQIVTGILTCVCKSPIAPGALKIIISKSELDNPNDHLPLMKLTQNEIDHFRKTSLLTIDNRA